MQFIDQAILRSALDLQAYRALIEERLAKGQTTDLMQKSAYIEYSRINLVRMARLSRTTRLLPEALEAMRAWHRPQTWLALSEGWCGDAAQILPVLQALAEASPVVRLGVISRAEHPTVMDAFLTNGTRSIPKVILVDEASRRVLGSWGPRPEEAQRLAMETKASLQKISDPSRRVAVAQEGAKALQLWYARDKTRSIQREFTAAALAATGIQSLSKA